MSFETAHTPAGELRLEGELDINHAEEARKALRDALARRDGRTVDLSGITEIDFIGVQVLLAARLEADELHQPLILTNSSPAVAEAFALLGLDRGAQEAHHES